MNWDYISGFFDADGSITFLSSHKGKPKTIVLYFTNTERIILEKIESFIRKETNCKGFISTKKAYKNNHKISYSLQYPYLTKTLPILEKMKLLHPNRKRKSDLAFYLKTITPRNGKYTKEQLKLRNKFEKEFFSIS